MIFFNILLLQNRVFQSVGVRTKGEPDGRSLRYPSGRSNNVRSFFLTLTYWRVDENHYLRAGFLI